MPSHLKLTPRHERIYDFIVAFKQDHDGIAPTVLEIGKACDISSTSMVRYNLRTLVLLGMIKCDYSSGKSRMISIPGARWTPPAQGASETSPIVRADHVHWVS